MSHTERWSGASLVAGCARALQGDVHVRVDLAAVARFADELPEAWLAQPTWDDDGMLDDTEERLVAWLMAYNAVNFCYWRDDGGRWFPLVDGRPMGEDDEALGVMGAFASALRRGVPLDDGEWLARVDRDQVEALLAPAPGASALPMMPERVAGLRELGRAWQGLGGPLGMVRAAGGSAARLVELLVVACPLWSDDRLVGGELLHVRKRAQLCVAMIAGRLGRRGAGAFDDLGSLTVFADYRLPQLLRDAGILALSPALADRIARGEPIAAHTAEEGALRAATILAADHLRRALQPRAPGVDALVVDHLLWRTAVARQEELPPFHRTRTTAY